MRSLWTGSLSFGLVNIPIRLYSASAERALNFKLFDKNGNCPISYVRICRSNHKEVPYEDIVRGYEYRKGDYVVLDEKDFERATPKKTDLIEVQHFSDENSIDVKYFEKPYYIESDKKSTKAYLLFRDALKETKKVAVATFIMRNKEHLAVIKPEGEYLILIQLRFHDEIKAPEFEMPKAAKYSKAELEVANALVEKLTKKFEPKEHKDTYTSELEEIIKLKAKNGKIQTVKKEKAPADTQMKDLMKMLRKSLEEGKKQKVH